MKRRINALSIALCCLSFATSFAQAKRTVFLLSVNGLAASYLPDKGLYYFSKLLANGTHAQKLIPVFPSLTFPNGMTMVTGCLPSKHGIVGNQFIDKQKGKFYYSDETAWLECEPLWSTAERQGIKTAVNQWPMSYRPWHGYEATYHTNAFDKNMTDEQALGQLLKWAKLPKSKRPNLLMSYLPGPDKDGHESGPSSNKVRLNMQRLDKQLEKFNDALEKIPDLGPYSVIIASDHGMSHVKEGIVIDSLFQRYWISGVPVVSGPLMYLYLWNPSNAAHVARELDKVDGLKTYLPSEFPKEFGPYDSRMGDVIGILEIPKVFLRAEETENRLQTGAHGYDPKKPSMDAVLIAYGDGIKKSTEFPQAQMLDIAATVTKLLGIADSKYNQGKPIVELLDK